MGGKGLLDLMADAAAHADKCARTPAHAHRIIDWADIFKPAGGFGR